MSGIHFDLDLNITYSGVIGLATLPASVPRLMAARGNRLLQLQSAEEDAAVLSCGQDHHECLLDCPKFVFRTEDSSQARAECAGGERAADSGHLGHRGHRHTRQQSQVTAGQRVH